jgi:hypothetical protein
MDGGEDILLDIEFRTKAEKCDTLRKKVIFCESFLAKHRPKHKDEERDELVHILPTVSVQAIENVNHEVMAETPNISDFKQMIRKELMMAIARHLHQNGFVMYTEESVPTTFQMVFKALVRAAKVEDYAKIYDTYTKR